MEKHQNRKHDDEKKSKKRKKHKKHKKYHNKDVSTSEEEEEWVEAAPSIPSSEKNKEKKSKKRKKHKKHKKNYNKDVSTSEKEEEWVEAAPSIPSSEKNKREDWMSSPFNFVPTISKKRTKEADGKSDKKVSLSLKVESHNLCGERVSYYPDDGKYSLKQMFEREKFTSAEDQNYMFLDVAGKSSLQKNDDYSIDDIFLDKASRIGCAYKTDEQERSHAIQDYRRLKSSMEKCLYCLDNFQMKKHLIISLGVKTYLYLPPHQSLTKGHCLIIPFRHISATTLLDEDEWAEVQEFRRNVTKMFEDKGQDVVFMETSMHLKSQPHTVIECFPLSREVGCTAPMYFKKGILECDTEWAINKKLIDTSVKGVQRSIPTGLPYFSVDFGLQGGFAHVIEDERLFPSYFGKEIIGGMLDLEPHMWRKPKFENFDDHRKKVLEFTAWWEPFDFTQKDNKD